MRKELKIKRFTKNNENMLDSPMRGSSLFHKTLKIGPKRLFLVYLTWKRFKNLMCCLKILEISAKHELDNYSAAILYHSNEKKEEERA